LKRAGTYILMASSKNEYWGSLHGLPMTIKDYINVTGLHTTYGSPMFKKYLPTSNADVVQPLIEAGAIIFGKTNLPLWAKGSQSFNEVYDKRGWISALRRNG